MWSHCQIKLRLVNTAVREGFKSVIDYWPESNEAILSTFMIGNCHLLQGEPKKAEKVFESVVIDYPEHYLATLAQVELLGIAATRKDEERQVELWTAIAFKTAKTKATATHRSMASRSLAMYHFREGEFPKINPELMFKALGGLFMGLVFMGDKKDPVSEKDVEKLLNQLITDPNYSSN
jgi:hypothetical protein